VAECIEVVLGVENWGLEEAQCGNVAECVEVVLGVENWGLEEHLADESRDSPTDSMQLLTSYCFHLLMQLQCIY